MREGGEATKAMLRQWIMPYPRQPEPVQRTQLDGSAAIVEQADSPGELWSLLIGLYYG